jgi:hypothetical protein
MGADKGQNESCAVLEQRKRNWFFVPIKKGLVFSGAKDFFVFFLQSVRDSL